MRTIPEQVRLAATFPLHHGPDVPPEMPIERIREEGVTLLVLPGPGGSLVEARALARARVPETVERVRDLLRERGRERAAWWVAESAEPPDLVERLGAEGFVPHDPPPFEPRFAAMARVEPPEPGPPDVEARPAASFEEYLAGIRVSDEAFALPEEDRRAWEEHERTAWALQASGKAPMRSFVALVGGEVVGAAAALLCRETVNLLGGSVRADARGRGVYRALVRARWEHAAARGTPALTVQAGSLSRPILERLGFSLVGWQDCLLDRFPAS